MRIIIYESSSKGGCYEYAHYLLRSFLQMQEDALLLVPKNSAKSPFVFDPKTRVPLLVNDKQSPNKWIAKLSFLFRQFANPIRFLFFLVKQPKSIVIWNDFEQLSAPLWAPLFRLFANKHIHTVVLHDPDRDNYPPAKWYSEWCMTRMMKLMDVGYYHGYLPSKKYYASSNTSYISIVHGVFDKHPVDAELFNQLIQDKGTDQFISILGNIREEKNYRLVIESLQHLTGIKLLIAGAPSNSSIHIQELKDLATELGVDHKIIWKIKFLTDGELAACIEASDILILYYQKQFTSQSGILNLIAPYQKKFVYSDMESGLANVCKQFDIGIPCLPDSKPHFVQIIQSVSASGAMSDKAVWNNYLKNADWTSIYKSLQRKLD